MNMQQCMQYDTLGQLSIIQPIVKYIKLHGPLQHLVQEYPSKVMTSSSLAPTLVPEQHILQIDSTVLSRSLGSMAAHLSIHSYSYHKFQFQTYNINGALFLKNSTLGNMSQREYINIFNNNTHRKFRNINPLLSPQMSCILQFVPLQKISHKSSQHKIKFNNSSNMYRVINTYYKTSKYILHNTNSRTY